MQDYSDLEALGSILAEQTRNVIAGIETRFNEGTQNKEPEAIARAVCDAFALCRKHPAIASIRELATTVHMRGKGAHITGFALIGGGTYPRTAEQLQTESQVRDGITQALKAKVSPADINLKSIERAYPTSSEAIRSQVDQIVSAAREISRLDLKDLAIRGTDLPPIAQVVLDALAQPPIFGTYEHVTAVRDRINREAAAAGRPGPYKGFQADHLVRDQLFRRPRVSRRSNPFHGKEFATLLHDGQIPGTQHRFATDQQKAFMKNCSDNCVKPTLGMAIQAAQVWMREIYLRSALAIDYVREPKNHRKSETLSASEQGFGLHRGGLMTRVEREAIATAAASIIAYKATRSFIANGMHPDTVLPFFDPI